MTPPEGLSNEQAQGLLRHYGPNEITTKPQQSSVTKFLLEFRNPLVGILLCAAMLSAFTGDWTSSVIVITVIVISAILDFVNTHKSEQAAAALKGKVSINVQVRRQGTTQTIPVHNLVPGDAVLVSPGAIIPADGTVLATEGLFVNESSITGESFPVQKKIGEQVWMGGSCVTGSGTITITATGKNTKLSQLADKLGQTNEQTEFDKSISNFSYLILKVTLLLVLFIFLAHVWFRHEVLQSFLFASALAVGLTPELLPMIISLNLAQGSLVMSKKGVIVKKLSAIQNFGSMDVLCTDKTGTLTQDKISLVKYVDVEGNQSNDALLYAYINSSFHEGFTNPLDDTIQEFTHLNASGYKKISEIPFDFARRRHSVIVETPSGEHLLITKGT